MQTGGSTMAFAPVTDTYYRIYFSHSNKCLDSRTTNNGEFVKQMATNLTSDSQLWRFRQITTSHYMLIAKNSNRALDVPGGRHEDNVELCQWGQSEGAWNEHFRTMPAGDGEFYLVARHSQKRIGVKGASKDDSAAVVQHNDGAASNFRLRFVADGESKDRPSDRDFMIDTNEKMRALIIAVAGKVPTVGSGLQTLMELLWPQQDASTRVWDQMKSYVKELVREMIALERLKDLSKELEGIHSSLADYNTENYGTEIKKTSFGGLLTALNIAEPYFFDERDPEKALPFFIALGSIRLATLRELCLRYKDIYGKDDDKAAEHLKALKAKIVAYVTAANKARERAMDWRLKKIRIDHTSERFGISTLHRWAVVDDYNGFRRGWEYNDTTSEDKGAESYAKTAKPIYEKEALSQYSAELDTFFGPARLWRYLDPTVTDKPKKAITEILTGPVGGLKFTEFQDDPNNERITAIDLHAGDHIDGIQFHYGNKPGPLHGKAGGHHLHYDLAADENIIGVWGRSRGEVGAVFFQTNKGRTLGGGWRDGDGVAEWIGDPASDTRAVLYRIGGRQGDGHVEALSFVWRYSRDE
ncbi:hypothetical protein ELE36_02450 [Pseudolysobacter antarcticus]|uniref:Jacalin-type lectin domain-containing protein n=2 Tax=Pseudolysobacter antarcticus TaxID=2511995 RepID=A0A411HFU4_9GAMM|nr:hypothetical protein ELE36_02450 [Pseudolysobacter antarcticus]